MHNLVSSNQMVQFNHFDTNTVSSADTHDLQNDYFDCLIECSIDVHTTECRRICRDMFQ